MHRPHRRPAPGSRGHLDRGRGRGWACLVAPEGAPTGLSVRVLALLRDRAVRAIGPARLADVAAEQDQPVVGVPAEPGGRRCDEAVLHRPGGLAGCQSRAIGHPEDVRVDGDRRLAEGRVQHHVRGLPPHARQRLEGLPVAGHLAAVLVEEGPAGAQDVPGLRVEQADRPDVLLQPGLAEGQDGRRRVRDPEQAGRGLVDAHVGGLGGQDHRDQQLKGAVVDQFSGRVRVGLLQAAEKCRALPGSHGAVAAKPCLAQGHQRGQQEQRAGRQRRATSRTGRQELAGVRRGRPVAG